jgi:hypothetical protein
MTTGVESPAGLDSCGSCRSCGEAGLVGGESWRERSRRALPAAKTRTLNKRNPQLACRRNELVAVDKDHGDRIVAPFAKLNESLGKPETLQDAIETVKQSVEIAPAAVVLHGKREALVPMHQQHPEIAVRLDFLHHFVNRKAICRDVGEAASVFGVVRRQDDALT